ncbi:Pentatricopeptide repeat-containing protein 2, mitochondrial [Eumeta japonica]|uniref:Pentatricopeptide repeat-containing protein 2, mitochondrial n=1 Tax=Eumeta variegata TaxID=151549 RepID=A0A4C1TIG8_EUMVA|nr:Pentatricopeptide repeat-containing protein 2, mitochondrial [Eumeta japonica]
MFEFVQESKNMIFTEDLKNIVHIAEPSDIELVKKMIKKFNTQSIEYRFGSFVFGPVVMRMFHFLDAPNDALECFEDPDNKGFFDQHISYQILLDLLYNHEMYDEMYRVFDVVKERQLNMTKFPKYSVVLILGACYKQAVALAEMGRVDDVLPILRGVLEIDSPETNNKHTFFKDTITQIRTAVEKSTSEDIQKEFNDIEKALRERQLIDEQTLDQLLNSEITTKKVLPVVRSTPPVRRQFVQHNERYMS